MFNSFDVLDRLAALPAELVILSIAAGMVLTTLLLINRKTRALQQKVERLQHELSVANNVAMGMGQQFIQLEKKWQVTQPKKGSPDLRVIENPSVIHNTQPSSAKKIEDTDPHEISRTLLKRGYSVEETAHRSGLSYSEVSLINAMSQR